jgi:hypothetical protein
VPSSIFATMPVEISGLAIASLTSSGRFPDLHRLPVFGPSSLSPAPLARAICPTRRGSTHRGRGASKKKSTYFAATLRALVLPETRHLRLHSVMANIPMAILASALQAKITTAFPARCRVTA